MPYTTFGRLRPLHTNAVIFAFGGNICFAGIYYSMQRLLKTRMFNDTLSRLHFWGWQLIIVCAAITLPLGMTQSKEYAELIWPIDLLITVVWVLFAVNFFGTIAIRKVQHLYVAIWFYMSFVHHDRGAAHREQPGDPRHADPLLSDLRRAHRRAWCNGGTGTTRSASS